jgi:predicted RNA-binding Zn-ribbon protein involved in translation (DUF1610 family)
MFKCPECGKKSKALPAEVVYKMHGKAGLRVTAKGPQIGTRDSGEPVLQSVQVECTCGETFDARENAILTCSCGAEIAPPEDWKQYYCPGEGTIRCLECHAKTNYSYCVNCTQRGCELREKLEEYIKEEEEND